MLSRFFLLEDVKEMIDLPIFYVATNRIRVGPIIFSTEPNFDNRFFVNLCVLYKGNVH